MGFIDGGSIGHIRGPQIGLISSALLQIGRILRKNGVFRSSEDSLTKMTQPVQTERHSSDLNIDYDLC